jgi:hypothetical protein
MPRAAELAAQRKPNITLKDLRDKLGGHGVSDEELVLRFIMKGDREIKAMRVAGPPKQYFSTELPLLTLVNELKKHKRVRFLSMQRGNDSLVLQARSPF